MKEVSFSSTTITHRYFVDEEGPRILVVQFLGKVGSCDDWHDSESELYGDHGYFKGISYMQAAIAAGKAVWVPRAVILDVTELTYQCEDRMTQVIKEAFIGRIEPVLVCSWRSEPNVRSLLRSEMDYSERVVERMMTTSLQAALQRLRDYLGDDSEGA